MFLKEHPKDFFLITLSSLILRFSFWGVANLLVLYLIQNFQFTTAKATYIYGLFTGPASFLPLLGGIVADRWNYRSPFLLGAILVAIGCFVLSFGYQAFIYPALLLLALGFGLFIPSSFAILSHIYRHNPKLKESGFSIYYASLNIGAFFAILFLGIIANAFSWNKAMFAAGVVQLLGVIPILIFLKRSDVDKCIREETKQSSQNNSLFNQKKQRDRFYVILIISIFSIFFWAAYSQGWSSISVFTLNYVNKDFLGFKLPTSYFLSLESLFIIFIAPFIAKTYSFLQKIKKDPSSLGKIIIGLFLMGLCFFILSISTIHLSTHSNGGLISSVYIVVFYFIMAISEILIGPIGPSFITQLSPTKYSAFLIGFWYLCSSVGYYLGGWFAGFIETSHNLFIFFNFFTLLNIVPAIILLGSLTILHKMSHQKTNP